VSIIAVGCDLHFQHHALPFARITQQDAPETLYALFGLVPP
jgi:hypothetical protein